MDELAFFEPGSLMTAGGAAFGIQLVANTLGQFGVAQRWTALILSFVIACINADWSLQIPWLALMTVLNTCFLFCTALGLSQSARALNSGGPGFGAGHETGWSRFFRPWF